jgi:5'(3')-deoxyribonucleotidase
VKTVLVDMDGVSVDFWGPVLREYNGSRNLEVTLGDIDDWSFPVDEIWKEPGFFASLEPIDGAAWALDELLTRGHDVYLVSAGHGLALSEKSLWVRQHLPFMKDRVLFTDGKTPKGLVRGDVIVDDAPHNLIDFKERNPKSLVIAAYHHYTRPANWHWDFAVSFLGDTREAWKTIVEVLREGR